MHAFDIMQYLFITAIIRICTNRNQISNVRSLYYTPTLPHENRSFEIPVISFFYDSNFWFRIFVRIQRRHLTYENTKAYASSEKNEKKVYQTSIWWVYYAHSMHSSTWNSLIWMTHMNKYITSQKYSFEFRIIEKNRFEWLVW